MIGFLLNSSSIKQRKNSHIRRKSSVFNYDKTLGHGNQFESRVVLHIFFIACVREMNKSRSKSRTLTCYYINLLERREREAEFDILYLFSFLSPQAYFLFAYFYFATRKV